MAGNIVLMEHKRSARRRRFWQVALWLAHWSGHLASNTSQCFWTGGQALFCAEAGEVLEGGFGLLGALF